MAYLKYYPVLSSEIAVVVTLSVCLIKAVIAVVVLFEVLAVRKVILTSTKLHYRCKLGTISTVQACYIFYIRNIHSTAV